MEWLAILGLAIWIWRQSRQITALTRKLEELGFSAVLHADAPRRAPARPAPPPSEPEREPLTLDTPLRSHELEPLLLDTPLPEASNDSGLAPARADPAPPPPADEAPVPFPPAAAAPPPRAKPRAGGSLEKWLAENGFAWLGGGMLALGGVFLVSIAVQQDWFTPPVQLACAIAFGLALIAVSEWARRAAPISGSPLVAAMLAGAGVATLYATAWAAHSLYHFIGPMAAGGLLALCAALLGALSLRHGQPLGVLAVIMALLAPTFASLGLWPTTGLTLYVSGVSAAGFALAAWRRWPWVAAAGALGLYFWFAAAIAADDVSQALAMASVAALGSIALRFRQPLADEAPARLSWSRVRAALPTATICASSILVLLAWILLTDPPTRSIARAAWVGAMLVALAAAAVRARAAAPAALAVAIAAMPLGVMVYLRQRYSFAPLGDEFYPFVLFSSLVIALAATYARPHRSARVMIAAAGAIGAGLLAALAALSRDNWHGLAAWAPLFATAAILLFCAWRAAREAQDPRTDSAVTFWAGAAAALLLLGVESAVPAGLRSAAHAGAALLLAGGLAWRGWGAFRYAALTAAALAIGHAFSEDLVGAALANVLPLWSALLILAATAALLFAASRVAARPEPRAFASEGLGAASAIVTLIGAFLALRWLAAGGAGAPLDGFTETALQVLALIAAGHVLLPRSGQETGIVGRWRGHALMGFGLVCAALMSALASHPWWGLAPAPLAGPPLFNPMALAFAAPAALAFAASNRLYGRQRIAARIYAGAGGALALTWVLSEVRRLFHGPAMASAPIGVFEGACYALVFLAGALVMALAARQRAATAAAGPFAADLTSIARAAAWTGTIMAALLMLLARHPWWGGQNAAGTDAMSTLLAVLAQGAAAALALVLGRVLSQSARIEKTRFAVACAAAVFAWSFGHSAIRWLYHQGGMDGGAGFSGLEGFAHALWPLAYVLSASALIMRAPGRDTARPYLYDLQAILASAIWPALAFAAFGLWLIFNPWWGLAAASPGLPPSAALAFAAFAAAAWMSLAARRIPYALWPAWLARARTFAAAGHLLVAATLAARWAFHRDNIVGGAIGGVEMWTYSAIWALFGAGAFWLGTRRSDALLRWIGLCLLLITTAKVFVLDMAQLSGVIRVGSFVGLGAVMLAIAWAARRANNAHASRE